MTKFELRTQTREVFNKDFKGLYSGITTDVDGEWLEGGDIIEFSSL